MKKNKKISRPLKIGYVWQYQTVDMTRVTASVLHVKAIREELLNQGHQVRLVTFNQGQIQWTDDLVHWHQPGLGFTQNLGFKFIERATRSLQSLLRVPFFRFFDSLRFAAACQIALQGYDAMYERFWLMGYGGLIAANRLNIPLVYEVNGDLVAEYQQLGINLSKAQWGVIHFITRQMFQKAGRVVAVSQPLKEKILERWRLAPSQVSVVDNGAMVDMFAAPADDQAVRTRYALNGKPIVMFVGSFKPWHGIDLLVEAFGKVAQKNTDARLMLVGDGPMRTQLETQVNSLNLQNRVVFTGVVPHQEVASLLKNAQVAILNPRVSSASSSQSPLKLFEYMAAGKAIVGPAIQNISRVLESRKNGLLVPPDDPEALASAISELLANHELRTKLGQTARKEALTKHSWERAVKEIETIFRDLLTVT